MISPGPKGVRRQFPSIDPSRVLTSCPTSGCSRATWGPAPASALTLTTHTNRHSRSPPTRTLFPPHAHTQTHSVPWTHWHSHSPTASLHRDTGAITRTQHTQSNTLTEKNTRTPPLCSLRHTHSHTYTHAHTHVHMCTHTHIHTYSVNQHRLLQQSQGAFLSQDLQARNRSNSCPKQNGDK